MRVAELSERSDVPVPTIKYYLREGLLPRGERTGPNQAHYDDRHERRLRLIRALTEVGGLSIAATRDVLSSVDDPEASLDLRLGRAVGSVTRAQVTAGEQERAEARRIVDELIERRGWIDTAHPARDNLVEVIAGLNGIAGEFLIAGIDRYADAVELIARVDLDVTRSITDTDAVIEAAVVGTIAGDALLAALRRLAQVNESGRRIGLS
ncbi:MAG: MerR family transcriptional regulator [Streptosporangiales bacterium]|nr:MerR family transcriptional regulator [Streptosporangiales bacterium]